MSLMQFIQRKSIQNWWRFSGSVPTFWIWRWKQYKHAIYMSSMQLKNYKHLTKLHPSQVHHICGLWELGPRPELGIPHTAGNFQCLVANIVKTLLKNWKFWAGICASNIVKTYNKISADIIMFLYFFYAPNEPKMKQIRQVLMEIYTESQESADFHISIKTWPICFNSVSLDA